MWRFINIGLVAIIVLGAAWTFQIKHQAELAEDEVAKLRRQIALERETIDILKADWSYLNNPERLQRIVEAFENELDLGPIDPEQIITLDELPSRSTRIATDSIGDALENLDGVTTGSILTEDGQVAQ
jgi:hypothetical protein